MKTVKGVMVNYKKILKAVVVLLAAMIFVGCGKSKENAANTDGQANGQTENVSDYEGEEYDGCDGCDEGGEEYDGCDGCDEGDGEYYKYYISGSQEDKDAAARTVSVSNTEEFLVALGSNRIIEMKPGRYEMSHYLRFNGIKNLTIRGAGTTGDKITEIVLNDPTSFVISFYECSDIVIENLKAGHVESGYCTGGVFSFANSSRISINGAYMYGSGTEGLELINVADMKVTNSRIYECTYYIMTVTGSINISFDKCEFFDNKQFDLVNVSETKNLSFTDCEFRGNRGDKMFNVNGSKVSVRRSAFRGNIVDESIENSDNVSFDECVFESVISVSNVKEFLEALGSNRIIEMAPGRYNLSEFDYYLKGYMDYRRPKGVEWLKEFDGGELSLNGIKNLTIRGAGATGGKITEIVVEPRYAFVLNFADDCSDIVIENLKAGHTESGSCSGGVFRFNNSSRISINGADMYGSGTEGLALTNVSDMNVTNSRIYECTYFIMTVNGSRNISFDKCEFRDNKEHSLVNVNSGTKGMSFTDCEFRDNRGSHMFNVVQDSEVSVRNSTFRGNIVEAAIENSDNVLFDDCVFE